MNGNANVGQCVDFIDGNGVAKVGYKIVEVLQHALRIGDTRYKVKSNYGNGNDEDIIYPANVTNIYDCNGDVEMAGGRKSRKGRKTQRKTRKQRKQRKTQRKTQRKQRKGSRRH